VAIDALAALAFTARCKAWTVAEQLAPPTDATTSLVAWAATASHPLQRMAAMMAAARSRDGSGRARGESGDRLALAQRALREIMQDIQQPCPGRVHAACADARALPLANACCGALLTSPPYYGRYDYARINQELAELHDAGQGPAPSASQLRGPQLRAHRRARGSSRAPHSAVVEAANQLAAAGNRQHASAVAAYAHDLSGALHEAGRVLVPGAPAWWVVAGATPAKCYIPFDLILAELAPTAGFVIEHLYVARELHDQRRLLGVTPVVPRETLICLRRR
jgi:hypothetical protein